MKSIIGILPHSIRKGFGISWVERGDERSHRGSAASAASPPLGMVSRTCRSGGLPVSRELLGRIGVISKALPLISTVLGQAFGLLGNTQFLTDTAATLGAWAAGLAITVAVGVPLGLILGSVPGVRSATRAIVEFLRPIPAVALIPLAALVLGPGQRMNITLVVYASI